MNQPLVTIITPTYNCEKYIGETVCSVLDNGYENIQYIIIDDGSSDGTIDRLAECDYGFDVFRLQISQHENKGEQATVNDGLAKVKGKYFMIVNVDDPLLPGAISTLVNFMESNPDILCAYPDWRSINEDSSIRTHVKSREYDFSYMVRHHTCLPSVGSMFKGSILKTIPGRDTSYQWLGDFDFWLRVGLAGTMARVPVELATWRHRSGQASKDKSDMRAQEHIRIIQEFYRKQGITQALESVKREAICWSYLVATAVTDSKKRMAWYILKAFMSHPTIVFSIEFGETVRIRAVHILRR